MSVSVVNSVHKRHLFTQWFIWNKSLHYAGYMCSLCISLMMTRVTHFDNVQKLSPVIAGGKTAPVEMTHKACVAILRLLRFETLADFCILWHLRCILEDMMPMANFFMH